jgi:hypothetical protein
MSNVYTSYFHLVMEDGNYWGPGPDVLISPDLLVRYRWGIAQADRALQMTQTRGTQAKLEEQLEWLQQRHVVVTRVRADINSALSADIREFAERLRAHEADMQGAHQRQEG